MKNKKAIICLVAAIAVLALVTVTLVLAFGGKQPEPADETTQPSVTEETTTAPPMEPKDYDNGVVRGETTVNEVLLENDFSEVLDPLVVEEWQKTSFFGSKAVLEDGWVHVTNAEQHLFIFGTHLWGAYGGIGFQTGKTYSVSFDLKKGSEIGNNIFTLTLAEEVEGQDPRFGDQLKQVMIDFSNYEEMVAFNSDKGSFAHVTYQAETGICHVEVRFTVDRGAGNYLLYARDGSGYNDWLIDNFYIADVSEEGTQFQWLIEDTAQTFDCAVNTGRGGYSVNKVLLDERFHYSSELKNGGRTAFFGTTKRSLDNGMARITTNQHLFTFGRFKNWENFGGVEFQKNHSYVMSFDLKLGDARTQKKFNLYVMQETDPDPRFGAVQNTLVMDFADLYREQKADEEHYFVKENTDGFASVKYDSKTRIAHVEIRFKRYNDTGIVVVSKGMGDNEWLLDNFYIADITPPINVAKYDYDNGIRFAEYETKEIVFSNDFSEELDKGVTQVWHKTAFYGSSAELREGAARVTSEEHLFTWGTHNWGMYGSVAFTKGATYKMSFDLQLGNSIANRDFELFVMTENGDPRYGDVQKALALNFMDFKNLVTKNTDNFASVRYSKDSDWAHIEILFTADTKANTLVVARNRGDNNWLIDNLEIAEVRKVCTGHTDKNGDSVCDLCGRTIYAEKDFDNGVAFESYTSVATVFENDFADNADKGVTQPWHKTSFLGSKAVLKDGKAHITSNEHVFVYGVHTWGQYGGVSFDKGWLYQVSFDLMLGDEDASRIFNLMVTTEGEDPRYGTVLQTLTLNFADFEKFVTENTDNFASVTYNAKTHTAHVAVLFETGSEKNTLLVARQEGMNDWYLDNLLIQKMQFVCPGHVDTNTDGICDICDRTLYAEKDFDNGVTFENYTSVGTVFENDFAENADKGVTQPWHKTSFLGSTAVLEDGKVHITSNEHVFVYGTHTWGQYGGVSFDKDWLYQVSFDLMLGNEDASRIFNLEVTTEAEDPRYGTVEKAVKLNFADFENFVTENTDNFASVTYNAETHTAHVTVLFKTDSEKNTLLVAKQAGRNDWYLDNLLIQKMQFVCPGHVDANSDDICDICGAQIVTDNDTDYDNGVSLDGYTVQSTLFENDFAEDYDKGVDVEWKKSAFNGSTPALEDGKLRLTSMEHLFVYGMHTWGQYGGVNFAKGKTYKVSLDLQKGAENANDVFNLYVMTENGDPRFGNIVSTLTLNFGDIANFVTANTGDCAWVSYKLDTKTAHIEMILTADASVNTLLVAKSNGTNNWLLDNLKMEEVVAAVQDYDNGVSLEGYTVQSTLFENDFAEDYDKGVDAAWKKSAFHGSTPALEDGKLRLTSMEHLFVYGMHTWGQYGGVGFAKGKTYKVSLDLQKGAENANDVFNLYVMTENGDPRFGNIVSTLTLNFGDIANFVTANTGDCAWVSYKLDTKTAHIELILTADASVNTLLVAKSIGTNNWLLDNLKMEEVVPAAQDYDNGVSLEGYTVQSTLFENDFAEDYDKGVDVEWKKSAFHGSTPALEDGKLRLTSMEHLFVYGMHTWGQYGGVGFTKGKTYKVSLDLQKGAENANDVFNLYVMTENGDPRFGNIVSTLTLNFGDIANFVTANTGDCAWVSYKAETRTAHIELILTADASVNTLLVAKSIGTNNWLLDNLKMEEVVPAAQDYDNGVSLDGYTVQSTLFENDFAEAYDKGVDAAWKKSAFFESTPALEDGKLRLTSTEHLFVYGMHTWGQYGGVGFAKGKTYKVSLDLQKGAENANDVFNLYVMTENGDPRFGNIVSTLTLNFGDIANFVTANTGDCAWVTYKVDTKTAHIEMILTADASVNTLLVAKSIGTNNWLLDNLKIEEVANLSIQSRNGMYYKKVRYAQ